MILIAFVKSYILYILQSIYHSDCSHWPVLSYSCCLSLIKPRILLPVLYLYLLGNQFCIVVYKNVQELN